MTYHLDSDSELRFEVEDGAEVQLEVIYCSVYIRSIEYLLLLLIIGP